MEMPVALTKAAVLLSYLQVAIQLVPQKRRIWPCVLPHSIILSTVQLRHRLVGLVVKASASRAEGPGLESRAGIFRGRVIPVT